MNFWQAMAAVGIGMGGVLFSVMIGGWLVFRAKTITMPSPFFSPSSTKGKKASNYLPDSLNEFQDLTDEDLSPAAARLRAQKMAPPKQGKEAVMAFVKGGK